MTFVANVNTGSVWVNYFQLWRIYLPYQLLSLLPIQLSVLQSLKSGHLSPSHDILSYSYAKLGSVGVN